ncbi:hypothetical protein F5Y06DRAFT_89123 [Hypoxylon sp. FL0890]|nr:hypothetical protein F5Y06DRAFT_89123 [Hypoxylon sp. FL0890]
MLAVAATLIIAALCDIVSAGGGYPIYPPLTGHDFDFTATYTSGLKLSTSDPPKAVLSAKGFLNQVPDITLTNPSSAGQDDRYISFLEISYIPDPEWDPIDDVIYWFPWVKTNLTVTSNGTLSDELRESMSIYHGDAIKTSDVRNATLHVWKQTPALMDFIDGKDSEDMPVLWQLMRVWSNTTHEVDTDFPRANVDFKIRNETGEFEGWVDDNGASIVGYVPTSTSSATAKPTGAASPTTASGAVPAATTTGVKGSTGAPSAASSQGISASWAVIISGTLLLASTISAIWSKLANE